MITSVRVARVEDGILVRFRAPQDVLVREVVQYFHNMRESDESLRVLVGCDRAGAAAIIGKVHRDGDVVFTLDELHVVHSALVGIARQFTSEESFHIRIGFYRENALDLAHGLLTSLQRVN
ncbi:hypothetical protein ACQPW3_11570 [Actinosynnema sp. CA-248983]